MPKILSQYVPWACPIRRSVRTVPAMYRLQYVSGTMLNNMACQCMARCVLLNTTLPRTRTRKRWIRAAVLRVNSWFTDCAGSSMVATVSVRTPNFVIIAFIVKRLAFAILSWCDLVFNFLSTRISHSSRTERVIESRRSFFSLCKTFP